MKSWLKQEKNYAFIDSQNVNLAIGSKYLQIFYIFKTWSKVINWFINK